MVEPPIELKPNIDEPDIPVVVQPNVVEPNDEQSNVVVDTGEYFVNCEKMKVRDIMIDWCKRQAENLGFSIVIAKSDNGAFNRKKYFILGCEIGGVYKEMKRKSKKEDTATRKTLCPFRLRGHLLVGRLKPEENECVRELTKNLVAPKNIMTMLKGRNPDSKTNMKQHLLKCCETHKYFHKCRTIGDSTTIQDIFWAHPESIKLFNTFPTVLMMDSTYKTNKYKMPLFEIVGVTSTEKSYNVGFAYIANEKEDNFVWALETCKSLLISKETFPKVIVTDRDKSLMNAVAKVFPNSTALVCRVHVYKNVKAKFKALCKAKDQKMDQLDEVNTHWKRLQIDETIDGEVDCLQEFNVIQERLKSSDHSMKLQIRDQLRLIAYPEITSLTPPIKQVDTKGAKKRGKSAKCNSSTTRSPSYWEYMDERFPDSQASQSKSSKPERKTARIGNLSPNILPCRSIKYMEYMPLFMHSYIEDIIDVKGDGHCGFRVAAECFNKGEENQGLVRAKLIRELTMFRKEYEAIYGTKERFEYILNGLCPPKVMPKSGIVCHTLNFDHPHILLFIPHFFSSVGFVRFVSTITLWSFNGNVLGEKLMHMSNMT
ncbi:hypothetical protein TSUD_272250 [Trifolium subterraneum]|uniref:Protein FAR1-RELATED SEQUENCE n=1 Tax=Trifolium subterraneum TaxID=3900 RepID=A0A2Z6PPR9_TRISU|nr:hypothetical protein TSUD_272250 [Trifolium subterraneum]